MNYSLKHIEDVVNEVHGVNIKDKTRKKDNMSALKAYCYFARKYTAENFYEIGKQVRRDHATIIYHNKDYNIIAMHDKRLREKHNQILELLNINENKDIEHLAMELNKLKIEVEKLKNKK